MVDLARYTPLWKQKFAANYNGGGSMRAVELLDQILQPLPLNPPLAPS